MVFVGWWCPTSAIVQVIEVTFEHWISLLSWPLLVGRSWADLKTVTQRWRSYNDRVVVTWWLKIDGVLHQVIEMSFEHWISLLSTYQYRWPLLVGRNRWPLLVGCSWLDDGHSEVTIWQWCTSVEWLSHGDCRLMGSSTSYCAGNRGDISALDQSTLYLSVPVASSGAADLKAPIWQWCLIDSYLCFFFVLIILNFFGYNCLLFCMCLLEAVGWYVTDGTTEGGSIWRETMGCQWLLARRGVWIHSASRMRQRQSLWGLNWWDWSHECSSGASCPFIGNPGRGLPGLIILCHRATIMYL